MIQNNAKLYNKRPYHFDIDVGQLVMKYRDPPESTNLDASRRSRALSSYACGPWRVLQRPSNNNYELQHIRSNAKDTFNVGSIVPLRIVNDNDPDTGATTDGDHCDLGFDNPY